MAASHGDFVSFQTSGRVARRRHTCDGLARVPISKNVFRPRSRFRPPCPRRRRTETRDTVHHRGGITIRNRTSLAVVADVDHRATMRAMIYEITYFQRRLTGEYLTSSTVNLNLYLQTCLLRILLGDF